MFALFALVLVACATSLSASADSEVLLTLNRTTQAPLSTEKQNGFIDQVVTEALSRVGAGLKTVYLPAERALIDANSGLIDGEISRVSGLQKTYKNLILVDEKLLDLEFTVFSARPMSLKSGWSGINGHSVAFLNGWKILERNVAAGVDVIKVNSPEQLFKLLKIGRVELVIYERWGGKTLAKTLQIDQLNVFKPALAVKGMYMYLHIKHSDLATSLEHVLKQMKIDGSYNAIYNKILKPIEDS
jgi:polar amino acid transport system substrate-binding protein